MFVDIMGTLYNLRVFNGFGLLAETNSRVGKNSEIFSFLKDAIMSSTSPNKRQICLIQYVPINLQFKLLTRATKIEFPLEAFSHHNENKGPDSDMKSNSHAGTKSRVQGFLKADNDFFFAAQHAEQPMFCSDVLYV